MAIDLNQGIDVKDLIKKIKSLFSKDSNVFGNKLVNLSLASVFVTIFLIYSIYEISDNDSQYMQAKSSFDNVSLKLNKLEAKFKKTQVSNELYFQQLRASPKTKSEFSAKITKLVSRYNILLKSINLNGNIGKQKGNGVKLVVSGPYLSLIRFSREMNKILAASQLINLDVKKIREGKSLVMGLDIIFSPRPPASSFPLKAKEITVKLLNLKSAFSHVLNLFVSSANAFEEVLPEILPVENLQELPPLQDKLKPKGLSLFQKAYAKAKFNGLTKFKFTNKAGETNLYLTGLKEKKVILTAPQELPEILPIAELTNLPPLESRPAMHVKKIINTKPQKGNSVSNSQKTNVYKQDQGVAVHEAGDKKLLLAGFVEKPTQSTQEFETQESVEPERLRDPFASPGESRAPKINSKFSGEQSENKYYLSGVIASDHLELCVVISPLGESNIYRVGQKITDKILITEISGDSILTNNSTKKIVIGDEVR